MKSDLLKTLTLVSKVQAECSPSQIGFNQKSQVIQKVALSNRKMSRNSGKANRKRKISVLDIGDSRMACASLSMYNIAEIKSYSLFKKFNDSVQVKKQ